MNASEARRATDEAISAYKDPLVARAIKEIEAAIKDAAADRRYRVTVTNMVYAHPVCDQVKEEFLNRGYMVTYESMSMRRSCPSGIYAYTLAWEKA